MLKSHKAASRMSLKDESAPTSARKSIKECESRIQAWKELISEQKVNVNQEARNKELLLQLQECRSSGRSHVPSSRIDETTSRFRRKDSDVILRSSNTNSVTDRLLGSGERKSGRGIVQSKPVSALFDS